MASTTNPSSRTESTFDVESEKKDQALSSSQLDDVRPESGTMAEPDQPAERASGAPPSQEEVWVTGFKLFTIMASLSLVCFLMLLDTSIIVTASTPVQIPYVRAEKII